MACNSSRTLIRIRCLSLQHFSPKNVGEDIQAQNVLTTPH